MSSTLLTPLNQLQGLAHTLFLSLSPPQTKPPLPPPLSTFLECDQALASAINLAHTHQIKQRKIDALEAEILALECQWREICKELAQGKTELEELIEEGEARIKAIEQAKKASIPYPELLAYAQSLSAFTSAPPNMPDLALPGQPPPPLFFPPFPNEEKMRRGRLNAEAPFFPNEEKMRRGPNAEAPLGETHSVGRPPPISPKVEANTHISGANIYRQDPHTSQTQFFDLDLDLNPDL